jgi:hypothetical protein
MTESHKDLLISRAVDGDATDREWDELTALATADPGIWREVAEVHRDRDALSRGLEEQIRVADLVSAPVHVLPESHARSEPVVVVAGRVGRWTGWAVAALIAVALLIQPRMAQLSSSGHPQTAGVPAGAVPVATADEAWNAYLDKGRADGRVVRELPQQVLVITQPTQTQDGFELLYVRQVLERTTVPDLYQVAEPEPEGQPQLVRYSPRPKRPM